MKFLIYLFLFTACCIYVYADDMRSCFSDENCKPGECCISMVFVRGFCHTFGQEGDHCIEKPAETADGKRNLFGCPCVEGLKCVPEIIEEDGKTIFKNPTCKSTAS